MTQSVPSTPPPSALSAAQVGRSFMTELDSYRRALLAHCYRMSGSLSEAEDLVQETLARAWRGRGRFRSGSNVRAWLYKIATRLALDLSRRRKVRTLPRWASAHARAGAPIDPPSHELPWLEPFPDHVLAGEVQGPEARYSQRESVALAFMAALQKLTPKQRAVLILRDVLGWSSEEVAAQLGTSLASINSALQRARLAIDAPANDVSPSSHSVDPQLLERYVRAWEARDLDTLTELLSDDAVLSMPPFPTWFQGRDAVLQALASSVLAPHAGEISLVVTRANGMAAVAGYQKDPSGAFAPLGIQVIQAHQGKVSEIVCFFGSSHFPAFDLHDRPA